MNKIYLCIPYTGMEEESFRIANHITSILMKDGNIVYSPISSNHPIAKAHGLPTNWDFWERFDTEFIKWCDCLVIVSIETESQEKGVDLILKSKGVQAEIKIANDLKKQISYFYYTKNQ